MLFAMWEANLPNSLSFVFYFSESPLDLKIKANLITDLFNLTGFLCILLYYVADVA